MSQKIAFITGGNRGLGFQTALDLNPPDTKVVIGSRDEKQGEEAVAKLRAAGVDADVLKFDITNPADHKAAYDYFNSKYGRLDIPREQRRHRRWRLPPAPAPSTLPPMRPSIRCTRSSKPTSSPRSRSPIPCCRSSRRAPRAAS